MGKYPLRVLKQAYDGVIEDQARFERAARAIWMTYMALFVGLFVVIWLRT